MLKDDTVVIMSRIDCTLKLLINSQIQDVYQLSTEQYCISQIGTIQKDSNIMFVIYRDFTLILEIISGNKFNLITKKQFDSQSFRTLIDNSSQLCQLIQTFDVYCLSKSVSKNQLSLNLILTRSDGIFQFYTNQLSLYLFTTRTDQKNLYIFNYLDQTTQKFNYLDQNIISVRILTDFQAVILLENSIVLINLTNAQIIQKSDLLNYPIKCTKCKLYIDKIYKKIFVVHQFYDGMIFDYTLIKQQQSLKVPGSDLVFNEKFIFAKSPTSCNIYTRKDIKFIQTLKQFSSSDYLEDLIYSGYDYFFIAKFNNRLSLFEVSQFSSVSEKDYLKINNYQLLSYNVIIKGDNQALFQVSYLQNEGIFKYEYLIFINYSPINTQCSITYPSQQYPLTSSFGVETQVKDLANQISSKNLILKSVKINLQKDDLLISYPYIQNGAVSDQTSLKIVGQSMKDHTLYLNQTVSNLQNIYNLIIEQVNIQFDLGQQLKIEYQKVNTSKLSKIIMKNIQISSFSCQTLHFKDLESVVIDNLIVENQLYYNKENPFFIFESVQTIIIKNLVISSSTFNLINPLISIQSSKNVIITNVEFSTFSLISQSMISVFNIEKSNNIKIENIKINNSNIDFSSFFYIIQSQESIMLNDISILKTNFTVSNLSSEIKIFTLFCKIEKSDLTKITKIDIQHIKVNLNNQVSNVINFQQPLSLLSISEISVINSFCYKVYNTVTKQDCLQLLYGNSIKNGTFDNIKLYSLESIGLLTFMPLFTQQKDNLQNDKISINNILYSQNRINHPIISIDTGEITIKKSRFSNSDSNQEVSNAGILITNSQILELNQVYILHIKQISNGFISVSDSNNVKISQSKFLDVIFSKLDQVLHFVNVNIIELFDSLFINNQSKSNGGSILMRQVQRSIIHNNEFTNSISLEGQGGVLYCEDSTIEDVSNNKFNNNQALKGSGGAIYLQSCELKKVEQNEFQNNFAIIGGAIRYKLFKPIFILKKTLTEIKQQNIFFHNIGTLYGQDIASYPFILDIKNQIDDDNGNIPSLQNVQSGYYADKPIEMRFIDEERREISFPKDDLDIYNDDVKFEFQSYILRIESSKVGIQGDITQKYSHERNSFYFNVTFSLLPTQQDQINIYTTQTLPYFQNGEQKVSYKNFASKLIVNFRKCQRGEVIQSTQQGFELCNPCSTGNYCLDDPHQNKNATCKKCPVGAFECYQDQIKVSQGYWKISESSDVVISCKNFEEACSPSSVNQREGCIEGHIGPLCESCDIYGQLWDKPYGGSSDFRCIDCEDISNYTNVLLLCLVFTFLIVYSFLQIYKQILLSQKQIQTNYLRRMQIIYLSKSANLASGSTYMKIMISYFQFLMLINSIEIKIPPFFKYFNIAGGDPSSQTFYSIDCLFHLIQAKVPIYVVRVVWTLFQPIAIFIGFNIVYDIYLSYSKKKEKIPLFQTSFNFIFIFYQPSIARVLIQSSSCRQIGDEIYIVTDITNKCLTTEHISMILTVFLPLMVVWLIFIPLYQIINLKRNKHNFQRINFMYRFGYLYQEYRDDVYYWDSIRTLLRSIIIICLNFVRSSPIIKALIIILVMVIYINRSEQYSPYKLEAQNKVDRQSCTVVILTLYLLLFNYFSDNNIISIVSAILMFFINGIFIFTMAQMIFIKKIPFKAEDRNPFQNALLRFKKFFPLLMSNVQIASVSQYRIISLWKKVKKSVVLINQVQNQQRNRQISYLQKSNLIKSYQKSQCETEVEYLLNTDSNVNNTKRLSNKLSYAKYPSSKQNQ